MNAAIEFHDSEVSVIEPLEDSLHVRFSAAYVHRSEGVPGSDAGDGYLQAVDLELKGAVWSGVLPECLGELSGGSLTVNQAVMPLVPLPFEAEGQVHLRLMFANGAELAVEALAIQLVQRGEARYVECFNC
jgi:hypothetical protein